MPLVYIYDGTIDGFFTCVFESYSRKQHPDEVSTEEFFQLGFEQRIYHIETDDEKAKRVHKGLVKKCGNYVYENIYKCFLSCDHNKATKLMKYVHVALSVGRPVKDMLAHADVAPVEAMALQISREVWHSNEFLRFAQMENGVYYARIHPKNNIIPLMMPHFSDRYNDQPFIIYDPGHSVAGVYNLESWYMVETDGINLPEESEDEKKWKRLWKHFYKSITIQERRNEKLRRQNCPKRYWQDMLEMPEIIRR